MSRRNRGWVLCGVASVAFVLATPPRAEVSVTRSGPPVFSVLIMGATEGGDPIPTIVWRAYRPVEGILNVGGEARDDNAPDVSSLPAGGEPVAVWSYQCGSDHDIAYAQWEGSGWGPIEFLTAGSADDLDPRMFTEADGTLHVVWWRAGSPGKVLWTVRHTGSSLWDEPVEVTAGAESGRRPSGAVVDGVLQIAYERDCAVPGFAQEVVVSRRMVDGTFEPTVVAQTTRVDRLDAVLHWEAGREWVDWKGEHGVLIYTRADGAGWGPLTSQVAPSTSWIGVEEARRSIRRLVLVP